MPSPNAKQSDLLTVAEVADELRASERNVQLWCEIGKLKAFKIGRSWRIRRVDLDAFLARQEQADPE